MHVIKTSVSKAYCEMQLTGTSDDPLSFVSPQDLLHSHVAEAGAGDATILRSASSSQLQQVHERLQGASPWPVHNPHAGVSATAALGVGSNPGLKEKNGNVGEPACWQVRMCAEAMVTALRFRGSATQADTTSVAQAGRASAVPAAAVAPTAAAAMAARLATATAAVAAAAAGGRGKGVHTAPNDTQGFASVPQTPAEATHSKVSSTEVLWDGPHWKSWAHDLIHREGPPLSKSGNEGKRAAMGNPIRVPASQGGSITHTQPHASDTAASDPRTGACIEYVLRLLLDHSDLRQAIIIRALRLCESHQARSMQARQLVRHALLRCSTLLS